MLSAPATVAVASPPAVDQYTQHLPTAGGGNTLAGETPIAHPGQLSSKTQAALSGPEGQVLAQIATAPSLGAPTPTDSANPGVAAGSAAGAGTGASVDSRSVGTVVADTAGTGPSLFLIGALVGIAVAGAWRFFRRRGSSSQPS